METTREFIKGMGDRINIPDIYVKLRQLIENPDIQIRDIEKLIESDNRLATLIIRFANSEFFGFERSTNDLHTAISLIGIIQLHDLLLGAFCMQTFNSTPSQALSLNNFWHQAIKRGITARSIANFCRLPAGDRFFTLGLLLEVGHAAMLIQTPELTFKSLQSSQQQKRSIDTVEHEYFGFDYCQLGAALLRQWSLPELYPQVIEHYLYPEQAKLYVRKETEVAFLSHHLCEPPDGTFHQETRILNSHQQLTVMHKAAKEVNNHLDEVFAMLNSLSNEIHL